MRLRHALLNQMRSIESVESQKVRQLGKRHLPGKYGISVV